MRKWMRERLQRRKKKVTEEAKQPAPPPLQPAYFDEGQAPEGESEPRTEVEFQPAAEPVLDAEPVGEEPSSPEPAAEAAPEASSAPATRGRSRRRRGGRGRGGRGREKSVANAFAPKGIAETSSETEGEGAAEPEAPEASPAAPAAAAVAASPRPPKGIVVLAIGLPGSGKSTWFKRHNVSPLSSDMMRSLLFDDIREQRFQDLVFSNLRSILKARLIAKRPMNYVDATNLTPQERQHWIKLAKDYNYEVQAVFFDVPLEVCIDRHQRRDRVVPEEMMRRMAAKLKPPSFDEGFAKITLVRVKKKGEEPAQSA
ncbi:MAG TPA: AAA family ATPase [Candidatus Sulfotelmatobacter sp.]|nr:AAA family ATPase [Candidatus Sulfotelmatobacter sp.]